MTVLDETTHYYGGYFHVKVFIYCDIPLLLNFFENEAEFNQAVSRMGASIRFERTLEKMAVPESEVNAVKNILMQTFYNTSKAYLSLPDFASKFVKNEYQKSMKKSPMSRTARA